MSTDFIVKRSTPANGHFKNLVVQLDGELRGRYGDEQTKFSKYNKLDVTDHVVLIFNNERPLACGAFRPLQKPSAVEFKRIYVIPECRGMGLAQQILAELEKWAREEKYSLAFLETGLKQPSAIAAYKRAGFTIVDNYGPYKGSSYSICMQKLLDVPVFLSENGKSILR